MGEAVWDLLRIETGLDNDGTLLAPNEQQPALNTIFEERSNQTYQPRAVLIDTDREAIDQAKIRMPDFFDSN